MTKKFLLHFGGILFFAFLFENANAQKNKSNDYASSPYWIAMMADTNTNYHEAMKAFNTYWSDRKKPESENEKFANAGKEDDKVKSKNTPYSFEYRKFLRWQMQVKPYVQNDGSILYPYQRLQLSKNARNATPQHNTK